MTVTYIGNGIYLGVNDDTKPTTEVTSNSLFIETDTGTISKFNGTSWDIIVGATKEETLTEKTLTSPTINSVTLTGTVTLDSTTADFLVFSKPGTAGTEMLCKWIVTDDSNSYMSIENLSGTNNTFNPLIRFFNATNTNTAGQFVGNVGSDSGSIPAFVIDGRTTSGTALSTRPLFGVRTAGTDKYLFGASALTFTDGVNMAFNTSTGTKIGTATTQKLGFYNATPVTQRSFISSPSADSTSLKTAVDAIRTLLSDLGLMAAS